MIRKFKSWLANRKFWRTVYWKYEPMTADQLHSLLGGDTLADAKLRAILQILEEHIEQQSQQISSPVLAEKAGALAHVSGGLESLRVFKDDLHSVMEGRGRQGIFK